MYIYISSYARGEDELYKMEMKYLFGNIPEGDYLASGFYIDVNRSPFVKYCIKVRLSADSLDELVSKVITQRISYENFKVKYLNTSDKMEFNEKHRVEGVVGYEITGEANVRSPEIVIGLTRLNDKWYLGELEKSDALWRDHNDKPRQYSNSLPTRTSRAIVNIAAGRNVGWKLIDPCCGIGTVVMEGLSMGLDIEGFDINPKVVEGAKENLKFFGYPDVITEGDIRLQEGHYDAAVIDIPYGLMSIATREMQREIIKNARRISKRLVLVTLEEMDEDIAWAGFSIVDKCRVLKRDFKRYITVCA